jgi:hypothetical protein
MALRFSVKAFIFMSAVTRKNLLHEQMSNYFEEDLGPLSKLF